jgi:hypothetical protein
MGYLDPGIFGMISQIGYVLLFALVSGFMFFFQPIKNVLNVFNRMLGRSTAKPEQTDTENIADSQQPGR